MSLACIPTHMIGIAPVQIVRGCNARTMGVCDILAVEAVVVFKSAVGSNMAVP